MSNRSNLSNSSEEYQQKRVLSYSLLLDRNSKACFDGYTHALDESEVTYFMQYFPDCISSSPEFIEFTPELLNGIELASVTCVRVNKDMYAKVIPELVRPALVELIKEAEKFGVEKLYMVLPRDLGNFMNLFRMLAYIGFKQVPPDVQKNLCAAPAVLMFMNFVKSN